MNIEAIIVVIVSVFAVISMTVIAVDMIKYVIFYQNYMAKSYTDIPKSMLSQNK